MSEQSKSMERDSPGTREPQRGPRLASGHTAKERDSPAHSRDPERAKTGFRPHSKAMGGQELEAVYRSSSQHVSSGDGGAGSLPLLDTVV